MKSIVEQGYAGTCANCHATNVEVRRVPTYDAIHKQNRGYCTICFKCFGRRVFWVHPRLGKMATPIT